MCVSMTLLKKERNMQNESCHRDMTHAHVCLDDIVTWPIPMCVARHDPLSHTWTWLILTCDMTHSHMTHSHIAHVTRSPRVGLWFILEYTMWYPNVSYEPIWYPNVSYEPICIPMSHMNPYDIPISHMNPYDIPISHMNPYDIPICVSGYVWVIHVS